MSNAVSAGLELLLEAVKLTKSLADKDLATFLSELEEAMKEATETGDTSRVEKLVSTTRHRMRLTD